MHSLIMRENANHYNKGAFSFGSKLTKGYSIMISRASRSGARWELVLGEWYFYISTAFQHPSERL